LPMSQLVHNIPIACTASAFSHPQSIERSSFLKNHQILQT
jgi:hypothetical protein